MKRIITIISPIILILFSCNPNKMGKVKYSEGGVIKSGTSKTKCTPPDKRYSKSLEVKVKASIDSAANLPKGDIELALTQAITRLSDYSSDGLDIDLILFTVCEMSNNKGFNAAETESLLKVALDAWSKKKSVGSVSVTNNGVISKSVIANEIGTIIIPEDNEIDVSKNFSITQTESRIIKDTLRMIFEIKPRQGVWNRPFFAYLLREDSVVRGGIAPREGINNTYLSSGIIRDGQVEYEVKIFINTGGVSTPNKGSAFYCLKKPSILFYGDTDNPAKSYSVKPF